MPKRLFVCSAILLILTATALPALAQDSGQLDREPTINVAVWELFSTLWSNLFSGSARAPSDPADDTPDDTPAPEQPSEDQCSGTTGCGSGGYAEQMPIGDPNG